MPNPFFVIKPEPCLSLTDSCCEPFEKALLHEGPFFLDTPILFSYILLGKNKSVSITSGHFVMSPKKAPQMPEPSRMCHAPQ
jgi:hypothetical protein